MVSTGKSGYICRATPHFIQQRKAAVYFFFSESLIRLFMNNESIVAYGSSFLHGFCLGIPFLCLDFLAVGIFQATGMGKHAFIFAILRKVVLEIPALCLFNLFFPLYGLAYAQFVAEVILAIAAVVVLTRLFRRLRKKQENTDSATQTQA